MTYEEQLKVVRRESEERKKHEEELTKTIVNATIKEGKMSYTTALKTLIME